MACTNFSVADSLNNGYSFCKFHHVVNRYGWGPIISIITSAKEDLHIQFQFGIDRSPCIDRTYLTWLPNSRLWVEVEVKELMEGKMLKRLINSKLAACISTCKRFLIILYLLVLFVKINYCVCVCVCVCTSCVSLSSIITTSWANLLLLYCDRRLTNHILLYASSYHCVVLLRKTHNNDTS